ncbi:MAG: carboxypeptidase-like regulatory domain-containing protein [Bryobacteraceae bacterium]
MKQLLLTPAILCLAATCVFASIDGKVVNRTAGKPQPGVSITLVKPGTQGMRTLGTTVSDASGRFRFENDQPGGGPQLLQANYKGVNYNKLITPNVPTSGMELDIYEATKSPSVARIAQRMLLLEPSLSRINVNETLIVQNGGNTTFNNDSLGAMRFYLPPAANGQVRISARGPQGMPLPRPAEKTEQNDIFKVQFPVKPGETEFQIAYVLPVGSPFTFQGRVVNIKGMAAGPLRLIAPSGVTLAGTDIQQVGTEPTTQANIYNVVSADNFAVNITGTGALHNTAESGSADTSDSPQVTEGRPQIYNHLRLLVLLAFSILGVGLIMLFRISPAHSPQGK